MAATDAQQFFSRVATLCHEFLRPSNRSSFSPVDAKDLCRQQPRSILCEGELVDTPLSQGTCPLLLVFPPHSHLVSDGYLLLFAEKPGSTATAEPEEQVFLLEVTAVRKLANDTIVLNFRRSAITEADANLVDAELESGEFPSASFADLQRHLQSTSERQDPSRTFRFAARDALRPGNSNLASLF